MTVDFFLFTLAFTLLAIISFGVFYYQIYSMSMERLDEELLEDEIEYYSEYLDRSGLEGLKKRLFEEAEPEDPEEEFFRIINFNGNVLAASDMSAWGPVDITGVVGELLGNEINHIFQTIIFWFPLLAFLHLQIHNELNRSRMRWQNVRSRKGTCLCQT